MLKSAYETLISLGFCRVGEWQIAELGITCDLSDDHASARNVIYAFFVGSEIKYIGKTFGKLRTRLRGYAFPADTQATNVKNHAHIRQALSNNTTVEVLAFVDKELLSFGGFHLNLAAGLEQSLINEFRPPWNGSAKTSRQPQSELVPTTAKQPETKSPPETTWKAKFAEALAAKMVEACKSPQDFVEIRAGDLHDTVSTTGNRMPMCCDAMHDAKRPGDVILFQPPQGKGNNLRIRYRLPRSVSSSGLET